MDFGAWERRHLAYVVLADLPSGNTLKGDNLGLGRPECLVHVSCMSSVSAFLHSDPFD